MPPRLVDSSHQFTNRRQSRARWMHPMLSRNLPKNRMRASSLREMIPAPLLPWARKLRKGIHLFRIALCDRIGLGQSFQSALTTDHPQVGSLAVARSYNRARTEEAGIGILDTNRVLNLHLALAQVRECATGDYAELGTYRGLTATLIWPKRAPGTKLFLFDTFAGFDERDLDAADTRLDKHTESQRFRDTSVDHVAQRINGGHHADLIFRPGFFPQTFAGLEQHCFRFVHIDLDLAEPIQAALNLFWPRLVEGGVLMVHDYFSARYPMARETVDRFFQSRGVFPVALNDRLGTALVRKQRGIG